MKEKKSVSTPEVVEEQERNLVARPDSPEGLIAHAIDRGVTVETMEKLLAMRTQLKAEAAKEAFDTAMAEFQGECPIIKKDTNGGQTNSGKVAYKYATLDSIVEQTKGLIKKYGFSYMIKAETKENGVKATCIVKHRTGHSEFSDMEVPLGTKTNVMSQSQVVAAAITFAKRYAFCNAFGIITGDDDTDGKEIREAEAKQSKIEKLAEFIKKADQVTVESYVEKMKKSTAYTEEEKKIFMESATARITELTKQNAHA
jgi:hypothetical protein